jgi:hypothetical protein
METALPAFKEINGFQESVCASPVRLVVSSHKGVGILAGDLGDWINKNPDYTTKNDVVILDCREEFQKNPSSGGEFFSPS